MKILIIGNKDRYYKYKPDNKIFDESELVFCSRGTSDDELLKEAADAQIILADAISPVSGYLMKNMKNLKMVHSEGVAFNAIDIAAAKELGIYVCNNKGANASAVAEQALLLMLACLKDAHRGYEAVTAGRQIQMKEQKMAEGITDLEDCCVGILGLGDIGKETAKRVKAFGSRVYYYSVHRKEAFEKEYGVEYLPMNELLEKCNIISLHLAVNDDTRNIVNEAFISHMRKDAYIINTSRGELVDNEALSRALMEGRIAGAGLDTIAPEPTTADNPLVMLAGKCRATVIYSPHIGGITSGSFKRIYRNLWSNVEKIAKGERPLNIVNGL